MLMRECQTGIDKMNRDIFRSLRCKSYKDAFDAGMTPISELQEVQIPGHAEVNLATTMLTIIVAQQVEYFNVTNTMSANQVADTVEDIIDLYPHMTLEEVATCFGIRRRSTELFNRLEPTILISWLRDYDYERDGFCEEQASKPPEATYTGHEMSLDEYNRWLEVEVAKGNPDAIEWKKIRDEIDYANKAGERRENAFLQWKREYERTGKL